MANAEDRRHLNEVSVLRESLLNWYEFRPDGAVLEICRDADHPASCCTKLLQRRCAQVTSIGAGQEPGSEQKYDYVVCVEQFELLNDPVSDLRRWMDCLKPDGRLLLKVENRYGLKYFCGSRDRYTGIPFDGVNGYLSRSENASSVFDSSFDRSSVKACGRAYSRKELLKILREAGITEQKFYYPVPDAAYPQMIYTDDYRNGINASERLVDPHYADPSMAGLEHRIFPEMIEDGGLPFLANDFLLEISKDGNFSDIRYAVVTTDRGEKLAVATTIRMDGTVCKRPIWSEGERNLYRLHRQTEELKRKGIPVVETIWHADSGCLSMQEIRQEGLSQVLERFAMKDRERFLDLFDRIYTCIQKASDPDGRTFIDLAPCNAFYLEDQPEEPILFYDQEFVLEDAGPQFAMFRTLKYFFASAPKAREAIRPDDMYRRYGISEEMLLGFEKKEVAFIESVRKKSGQDWLFRLATPDYKMIRSQMERLKREDKPYHIGYVPGVYDLFHRGHLRLFERCKERCDYLIVGVLVDELVEFYKGKRPVISYEDRAAVIRGLRVVDEVIPVDFSNTDKLDAWEMLHYDCHFSGDDHVGHWNDILEELQKRGSNMEFFSYTEGISSTDIRKRMR